jgi:hypothetical protein
MAVPDDPEDIDIPYMQAVADVFAHNDGEIIREAVEHGELTDRLIHLTDRAYGEELRDRSILGWQEDFTNDASLPGFEDHPGDPVWTVAKVYADDTQCVGLKIDREINATAAGEEQEADPVFMVFSSRAQDESAWMPWRIDRIFALAEGGELEENPCSL